MRPIQHLSSAAALSVLCAACALVEPERPGRTLPEAFPFEEVSLRAVQETIPGPDSVNVRVYVVGINECPDNARCFLPDGITVAERPDADAPGEMLHVFVQEPRQFVLRRRYVLSLHVAHLTSTGGGLSDIRLLGYSPAP